ncbi:MAG: fasciclin domain-containing protein [Actinomycetota bacterium]
MNPTTRALAGVAVGATLTTTLAGTLIGAGSIASAASASDASIVDTVVAVSGAEGFDTDDADYDLLREALVATGLLQAVMDADDITVFAPTDRAFVRLARDLGFEGHDEAGAFSYLADVTGFVSADEAGLLDDVLLYHVSPGAKTVRELRRTHPVTTLLDGATFEVSGNRVLDGDPNDRDARIRNPRNLVASDGIIQTVNRVLRPVDLEAPAPATVVDVVLETSGATGFDRNLHDFDLLREAVIAADLVGALSAADSVTVLAPTDLAFARLAHDLGYQGGFDEAEVFGFIAEATGYVSPADPGLLDDVLLYHVLPSAQTRSELRGSGEQATLLTDATLDFGRARIGDADPDARDPRIIRPRNVDAGNGIVHAISRVLRPIDL